ncbi:hypothetical protein MAC_06712 [Metarhizium acridum CQMa 102]|uniref:Uncharacterized protein n=1 Tax=Metarhizium acridum (strain CQMa 102) TaxID=655827 RepID=E9EA14_METAQ|nr:uncharacterized protein MAC_06712 [Metarhizium acridum CQMa 102]EFY87264.1 hypothetical protein MAC_06712 [Metarhizium acridum CQMa 102]
MQCQPGYRYPVDISSLDHGVLQGPDLQLPRRPPLQHRRRRCGPRTRHRSLGLRCVGGVASVGGESSNEETFSCDSILTTYFDPTDDWVSKCLASMPVHDYTVGSACTKEVYIITGLKVATNLHFGSEAVRKADADTRVGVNMP